MNAIYPVSENSVPENPKAGEAQIQKVGPEAKNLNGCRLHKRKYLWLKKHIKTIGSAAEGRNSIILHKNDSSDNKLMAKNLRIGMDLAKVAKNLRLIV